MITCPFWELILPSTCSWCGTDKLGVDSSTYLLGTKISKIKKKLRFWNRVNQTHSLHILSNLHLANRRDGLLLRQISNDILIPSTKTNREMKNDLRCFGRGCASHCYSRCGTTWSAQCSGSLSDLCRTFRWIIVHFIGTRRPYPRQR